MTEMKEMRLLGSLHDLLIFSVYITHGRGYDRLAFLAYLAPKLFLFDSPITSFSPNLPRLALCNLCSLNMRILPVSPPHLPLLLASNSGCLCTLGIIPMPIALRIALAILR